MTRSEQGTLGIDFGTSNSAAAWAGVEGDARLIPLEGAATALPTAIFYNAEDHSTHFGREAIGLYLSGAEGRLMRSLKSLLGSPLLLEKTLVNGQPLSFQDIIATFLAELRERAARHTGQPPARVVLGRPVHFVDDAPERDREAQAMLLQAARQAGFDGELSFQLEPIAAAFDYERRVTKECLALIVDIGGGTSDFTVVRLGPERRRRAAGRDRSDDILATSGVHIGGTDFDHRLNLEQVMPLLGLRHQGPQGREVPSAVFHDLSTWHLIHWRQTARALREAQALRSAYRDTRLHGRLVTVLAQRHGHRIANAVEAAKIDCSVSGGGAAIDLSFIEPGLGAEIGPQALADHLQALLARVVACARECLTLAGLPRGGPDAIYLTGGSSALKPLQQALRREFGGTELVEGDLFGGVASGLAYSAPA
ncbi:Hsp70 family protein [Variovorax terrae]|uniref:Hsp70 family protein n=1 Tax=Variovorax terrae TaxID=2923278 RepID=A0A9X1W5E4_9BURK|nr:Hsp70 family protein [Variovorax terrae]MCJ0766058.1 Hsp70 family protein [Variovorax terrae]